MRGRTMYVVPFSMGPLGSRLSKIGVELTDSPYVAASMGVMAKMGADVLAAIGENSDFVRCVHSVGRPLPLQTPSVQNWPCNPEKTQIAHLPDTNEIFSYGSGYGGTQQYRHFHYLPHSQLLGCSRQQHPWQEVSGASSGLPTGAARGMAGGAHADHRNHSSLRR